MKYIVFWFILYASSAPVKKLLYDEFGRVNGHRWVYAYDSIPRQREFTTRREAGQFVERMGRQCPECFFVKIDSIKIQ